MVALKGKPDTGEKINTQIIQPLTALEARSEKPACSSRHEAGTAHGKGAAGMTGGSGCQTAKTIRALAILRQAVAGALERKRRLGQYAVIWQDGRPVQGIPDEAEPARRLPQGGPRG